MQQEKTPKVSVCIITYNHEKYIRQCLQSIVDQETDFKFEVIVGDDCSTDGTRSIVQKYAERYPGVVKPIFHEKNIGGMKNYFSVYGTASGAYIAHIDGDDYALPRKLQVQTDILDSNPNCNIVWHRMRIENTTIGKLYDDVIDVRKFRKPELCRADLLDFGSIAIHSSKMYRASASTDISLEETVLDYYLDVVQIGDGFAIVVDDFLGVHRYGIGMAANSGRTKGLYLSHLEYFYNKFPQYKSEIGTNALWCFLVDLKNLRLVSALASFKLWTKCFSFASLFRLLTSIRIRKMLRTRVWD